MIKINYDGEEGYFITQSEKKQLDKLLLPAEDVEEL